MELDQACSELSHEIKQLLEKYRAKRRKYPQAVWDKVAQLIKRIGLEKTCKLLGLTKPHVATKLGYDEDRPKPSAAVMEFSQPITWASPCSPGMVVQIDYDGLKVKVEVENPLAIKWGDFFEAVKRSGGAR